MIDRLPINIRFFECYPTDTYYTLAKKLEVHHSLAYQWHAGLTPVPWHRLKDLVDEQGLSWDWIIDGKEPKYLGCRENEVEKPLNCRAINQRFLSLFPKMTHIQIGREIGVNPGTVSKWRRDISQVPWERLKDAVDTRDVTWEWLLEGR
jgi:hypothetical protein